MENNHLKTNSPNSTELATKQENASPSTISAILTSDSKQISTIARTQGDYVIDDLLRVLIVDLAKFFSVGKNTTEYQVTETVRLIRSEYFYLKPEDFRLCFDWLRLGKYGRMYDRFDGAIILEALIKYTDERAMEAEKVVRLKQKEDASNLYQIFDSPVLKPVLDKVHKEVTDKLVMKEQEPRRPQMNDVDLYIEDLWAKRAMNSRTIGGVAFISYKGREMAREEFLKLKYQQLKNISQKLL